MSKPHQIDQQGCNHAQHARINFGGPEKARDSALLLLGGILAAGWLGCRRCLPQLPPSSFSGLSLRLAYLDKNCATLFEKDGAAIMFRSSKRLLASRNVASRLRKLLPW